MSNRKHPIKANITTKRWKLDLSPTPIPMTTKATAGNNSVINRIKMKLKRKN